MNITFKKLAAVLAAASIAVTMSGCRDNGYIMTVDGMQIRNGVYLSMQQSSFGNARDKLDEAAESDNSDTSSDTDDLSKMIDGMTYSDWVKADTRKLVLRFVGIQRLCEQSGIALTDDELSEINSDIQTEWNSENYILQYINPNFKVMGDYYESLGIGMDSMREINIANELNDKLFLHYYGEDGEKAVPDDEIDKYMTEHNAAYNLITIPYQDYHGDPLVTDEEKQVLKDLAKQYADDFNNGAEFIDILYDFDLKTAQDKARKEAEESYKEDNEEGLTKEEYVQKAVDEATAEKGTDDAYYDEVIQKDGGVLSDELEDYIFNAPVDGKATVLEGTTSVYVVVRKSVLDLDGWREYNLSGTLKEMKNEEFISLLDELCQNYTVEQNDYLVDKKYSPEKMSQ